MENRLCHHDHATVLFHRPRGAAPLDQLGQFLFEGTSLLPILSELEHFVQ
jgi:hypothetical protein